MEILTGWFQAIGWSAFLDTVILTFLIYSVLVWFKQTRTASVLIGIVIVAAFYLFLRQFNLVMTALVFEKFFGVFLIALVVIFQEELRSFFERVAEWSTRRHKRLWKREPLREQLEVQPIVRAVAQLANEKTGALIIFKGKDAITRHLDGGIPLEGIISGPMLLSIFDSSSPGHDGAVIIENNRISRFAAHLPLSKNIKEVGEHGTRHSAGLGLSELCDALCVIVSEERGTVSIARKERLRKLSGAEELVTVLNDFFEEVQPAPKQATFRDYWRHNSKEKLVAIALAAGLWFVNVYSSEIIYMTYSVPVTYTKPPKGWVMAGPPHESVKVTFHGARSAHYFLKKEDFRFLAKYQLVEGEQKIHLFANDLEHPKDIILDGFEPEYVELLLVKKAGN